MNGYHDATWGLDEWLAMGTLMLLFWGLLFGLVVWVVFRLRAARRAQLLRGGAASPGEVLRQRFARGDIDAAEFRHDRELLRHDGSGAS